MNSPLETYDVLREKDVKVFEIVQFHLERISIGINQKISFKQKYKNPWTIEVVEFIQKSIFYEFFRAVRDYKISFGRNISTIKDKKKNSTSFIIEFTHYGCMRYHFTQSTTFTQDHIDKLFTKTNSIENKANIVINEEKPLLITYKIKTGMCSIKAHYMVKNKYGTVCSF